jgi:hypothetical protein
MWCLNKNLQRTNAAQVPLKTNCFQYSLQCKASTFLEEFFEEFVYAACCPVKIQYFLSKKQIASAK